MKRKMISLSLASAALALFCGVMPAQMANAAMQDTNLVKSLITEFSQQDATPLVRREYRTAQSVSRIEVEDDMSPIEVRTGTGSEIVVEYGEPESQSFYSITVRGDTLRIDQIGNRRGNYSGDNRLVITLPEKEYTKIEVDSDNGEVLVENLTAQSLEVGSDNGSIQITGVTARNLSADSDNGKMVFTNTTASRLEAEADNGEIVFDRVRADFYECETDNGTITGTLVGSAEEYAIQTTVRNGSSNLQSRTLAGADKFIRFKTDNGRIEVQFEG